MPNGPVFHPAPNETKDPDNADRGFLLLPLRGFRGNAGRTRSISRFRLSWTAEARPGRVLARPGRPRDAVRMRLMSDDDDPGPAQRFRERARQQAETLVPRPGCPIYGLAFPALRPAIVGESSLSSYLGGARNQMAWEHITLCYGDTTAGPYAKVTTTATGDGLAIGSASNSSDPAGQLERRLRLALEPDQVRADRDKQRWSDLDSASESAGLTRERLPMGDALIMRQGDAWAARLAGDGTEAVTVTVLGTGVAITDVRLERLPDLRNIIEAHYADIIARVERARRQPRKPPPPPPPGFTPAEGPAALRALADFSLANAAGRRAAFRDRRRPSVAPDWGAWHGALWRQAAAEYRRLSGADARTADDVVTTAVNHLLHLQDQAPWFTADVRLREAATDETVLYAMLGTPVLSEPAQLAWNRYWSARMGRQVDFTAGDPLDTHWATDWRTAWDTWTHSTPR